ncbi:MAG: hypothetical protein WBX81_12380 [Nitrososphaeraceae archaeon]
MLTEHELNMYRTMYLCALNKLAKGLIDDPVSSDQTYRTAGITGFPGGILATDTLVDDAVVKGYVKSGIGRKIMLTDKGLQWCKENCQ